MDRKIKQTVTVSPCEFRFSGSHIKINHLHDDFFAMKCGRLNLSAFIYLVFGGATYSY